MSIKKKKKHTHTIHTHNTTHTHNTHEHTNTQGATSAYYSKAVACVEALRAAAVQHAESEVFNAFLASSIKAAFSDGGDDEVNPVAHAQVWDMLCEAKVRVVREQGGGGGGGGGGERGGLVFSLCDSWLR
jgi:hypothetical protein